VPQASFRVYTRGGGLENLLLTYCGQSPRCSCEGFSVFVGFAGKIKSRRADSNRLPAHYE
jgi:hypothetical protein